MSLLAGMPPGGFESLVDASVAELVGHVALALGTRARPAVSAPLRLHHLGADAIATGKGLAAALPAGWPAAVTTNGEERSSIELRIVRSKALFP